MKKKYFKRIVSIVLALAVFVMFPMTFTQEAQAASTKTFYVRTSAKTSFDYGGDRGSYEYKYTRDKNGLLTKSTWDDGHEVYTRNSKGYVTKIKYYDGKKLTETNTFVYTWNSDGLPKTEKCYIKSPGSAKELYYTSKFTYYSNKHVKKEVSKGIDGNSTTIYWKNGNRKSYSFKGKGELDSIKVTYDSHGNDKTYISKGPDYTTTEKHTTLKYDKKGNLIKDVFTVTDEYDTSKSTNKVTTTIKYKYDKHGNILKSVTTSKSKGSYGSSKSVETNTYKYKAVKVDKKYWHFYE